MAIKREVSRDEGTVAGERLPEETIHEVLSNSRRRSALELVAEEGPLELGALAELIAAREAGETPAPRDVRRSVYVSLQQRHVPRLAEIDAVDYDEETKAVSVGEELDHVRIYLEIVPPEEIAWSEVYAGLGVLGLLLTVSVGAGLLPFLPWSEAPYAAVLFSLVAAAGLYQRESHRLRD